MYNDMAVIYIFQFFIQSNKFGWFHKYNKKYICSTIEVFGYMSMS